MKRFKKIIRTLLLSLLGVIPLAPVFSQPIVDGGSWKTGVPMNNLIAGHIALNAVGGKMFAMGGLGNDHSGVNSFESYDPVTKKWTVMEPMPFAQWGHSSAVLNGKIFIIGGIIGDFGGSGSYVRKLQIYDPLTNTWQFKEFPLNLINAFRAAVTLNGKIYLLPGGFGSSSDFTFEYDDSTNEWTSRAPMNIRRNQGYTGVVLNGKVYAIGGANPLNHECEASVEEYNPVTDTWKMIAPMSVKRCNSAAVVSGGKIYVIGGDPHGNYQNSILDVEEYDPATNKWHVMAPMLTPRSGVAAVKLNNKIYAIGGGINGQFLNIVEEYTPPQNCLIKPPVLSALISGKTGIQSARQWTVTLTSTCFADEAQIDGLTLTQTFGAACTPIITSPLKFPLKVGDIEAHGEASGVVTINFSGCANNARFSAKVTYSANDGTVHGSKTLNNQYR